jgi:hypothetical protein
LSLVGLIVKLRCAGPLCFQTSVGEKNTAFLAMRNRQKPRLKACCLIGRVSVVRDESFPHLGYFTAFSKNHVRAHGIEKNT